MESDQELAQRFAGIRHILDRCQGLGEAEHEVLVDMLNALSEAIMGENQRRRVRLTVVIEAGATDDQVVEAIGVLGVVREIERVEDL